MALCKNETDVISYLPFIKLFIMLNDVGRLNFNRIIEYLRLCKLSVGQHWNKELKVQSI